MNNLIPIEVYSGIIIMAITTTMIFPLMLNYQLKKNPKILNA